MLVHVWFHGVWENHHRKHAYTQNALKYSKISNSCKLLIMQRQHLGLIFRNEWGAQVSEPEKT
jgi:hypothetical protein